MVVSGSTGLSADEFCDHTFFFGRSNEIGLTVACEHFSRIDAAGLIRSDRAHDVMLATAARHKIKLASVRITC